MAAGVTGQTTAPAHRLLMTATKTRLSRISPWDLGLFLASAVFLISLPGTVTAFAMVAPGRTMSLNGFFSFSVTGGQNPFLRGFNPLWLVVAYPFINALAGMVAGFLLGCLYNLYARLFGGLRVSLGR